MFYREAGDFKTSYQEDSQTFPIRFDRYRYYVVLLVAFAVVPFFIDDYWVNAVFLPFLIYSIAAIGLNILTGWTGLISLGQTGFMVLGAYGYASEFPMERYVRDSLALPIFGGSSALQPNNIVNWMGLPK